MLVSVYIGFYYGDTSNINHTLHMHRAIRESMTYVYHYGSSTALVQILDRVGDRGFQPQLCRSVAIRRGTAG